MKSKHPLSVIPYYGGKARMASFIADRLDYSTSIFVTLFGGGCRELLNKPPHAVEYYNEYDSGLCALMSTLANPNTSQQFIDYLYYETEPTEEQFQKAKKLYDRCRYDAEEQYRKELKKFFIEHEDFVIKHNLISPRKAYEDINIIYEFIIEEKYDWIEADFKNKDIDPVDNDFLRLLWSWCRLKYAKENMGLERYRDMSTEVITDFELAVATYLVYTLSFSGIGGHPSKNRFKTDEHYRKHILNLYPCAERLRDVHIWQLDAMDFFMQRAFEENPSKSLLKTDLYMLLNDPDVMIFADPSYISPDTEEKTLHNENENIHIDIDSIDIEIGEKVSTAIDKAWKGKKMPKNLGESYARSFGYKEQEAFLIGIQDAKCKMMVCNYDLKLYNKYLTPEKGWYKETFSTFTSLSNKIRTSESRKRLEVIWRNY